MRDSDLKTPSSNNYDIPSVFHSKNNQRNRSSQRNTNDQLCDSFGSTHQNKLPINLFHSTTEYNKMLITNGRCIKKVEEPQMQGFVDNLEYINQPIFYQCSKRKKRNSEKQSFKKQAPKTGEVHSFAHECSSGTKKDKKCPLCIESKQDSLLKLFQNQKIPHISNKNQKRTYKNKNNLKKVSLSCKNISKDRKKKKVITSNLAMTLNFDNNISKESNSYLTQKKFNIDDLLCQSLIKFQEEKREKQIKKIHEKQKSLERQSYLKIYAEEVKRFNKSHERYSSKLQKNTRSKSQNSKIQKGKNYWQKIKDYINFEIKKDNLQGNSKAIVELLKNSLKQNKNCSHKSQLTPQMIQFLRKQRQVDAKNKLAMQKKQRQRKERKIQNQLKRLSQWQKINRKSCEKKHFSPTEQMIENAFMNLNDNESKQKDQKIRKSIRKNKGI